MMLWVLVHLHTLLQGLLGTCDVARQQIAGHLSAEPVPLETRPCNPFLKDTDPVCQWSALHPCSLATLAPLRTSASNLMSCYLQQICVYHQLCRSAAAL